MLIANSGSSKAAPEEPLLSDGKNEKYCKQCKTHHPDWYACPEKTALLNTAYAAEENRALHRLRSNKEFSTMIKDARKHTDAMNRLEIALKAMGWDGTNTEIPGYEEVVLVAEGDTDSDPED